MQKTDNRHPCLVYQFTKAGDQPATRDLKVVGIEHFRDEGGEIDYGKIAQFQKKHAVQPGGAVLVFAADQREAREQFLNFGAPAPRPERA